MTRTYFGTDGIRGTVGQAPITPDFMLRLGHAVGQVLRRTTPHPTVVIGKDTRISGYMLESALEAGFASAGVDVLLTGPLPTPGVAYLTRAQRLDLGVVISASHNPFADNGIKFFSARGEKLPDEWELAVEAALEQPPQWAASSQLGKARRLEDAGGRYIEFCKSTVPHSMSLRGMKLVVDAAHGAAYQVAPAVFHELGASVVKIGCSPDGLNINEGVGATAPAALVAAVAEHRADYGIALDGDADRLQLVDAQGRLYNGDELLYVMAMDRIAQQRPVAGVVGTLMTNMAVEQALVRQGVAPGWRRFRAPARPRSPHHGRRHRQRPADPAGGAAPGAHAGCAAGGRDAVPAGAHQRAPARGQRLEDQRVDAGCPRDRRARARQQRAGADPAVRHGARAAGDGRGPGRRPGPPLRRAHRLGGGQQLSQPAGQARRQSRQRRGAGGSSTLSMTCTTPLVTATSAWVTTASSTVTKVPAFDTATLAPCTVLTLPVLTSAELTLPGMTW
jgi:hypothetical protein